MQSAVGFTKRVPAIVSSVFELLKRHLSECGRSYPRCYSCKRRFFRNEVQQDRRGRHGVGMSLKPGVSGVWKLVTGSDLSAWNSFSPQIVAGGTYTGRDGERHALYYGCGARRARDKRWIRTKFAGAAWLRINRQAIAGAPGNLTITCNGYDASGAAFTGRTFIVALAKRHRGM